MQAAIEGIVQHRRLRLTARRDRREVERRARRVIRMRIAHQAVRTGIEVDDRDPVAPVDRDLFRGDAVSPDRDRRSARLRRRHGVVAGGDRENQRGRRQPACHAAILRPFQLTGPDPDA